MKDPTPPFLNKNMVIPVYDIGDAGESPFVPFIPTGLLEQNVTISALDELLKSTETLNNITSDLSTDFPILIAKDDTATLLYSANDAAFSRTLIIRPNKALDIIKCFVSLCFGINVSAYTSGDVDFDKVTMIIRKRPIGSTNDKLAKQIMKAVYETGITTLTATGAAFFILQDQFDGDMIDIGEQLEFEFVCSAAKTGTATFQQGLVPFFPFAKVNNTKVFSAGGVIADQMPRMKSKRVIFTEEPEI